MGSKITKLKAKKKSRSQPGSNAAVDNQAQGGEAAAAPVATSVPAPVATEEEVAAPAATTPSSIQLFTRGICPFSEQVRIALTHKQLPFVFDDISGKPVPEWWSQATSDDTVPVLLVIQPSSTSTLTSTSTYMNDSDEMLEWIDKQQPPQQALRIPASYAVSAEDTEKWVKLIRSEWIPSQMKLTMSPNPQIQQEFRPKLKAAFEAVVVHLKTDRGGPYFLGAKYSLIDILLTPFIRRLPLLLFFRSFKLSDPVLDDYANTLETTAPYKDLAMPLAKIKKFIVEKAPKMPPMSAGRLQHNAIKKQYEKAISTAKQIAAADKADDVLAWSRDLHHRVSLLILFINEHAAFEEEVMYPIFEEMKPGSTSRAHGEHEHEIPILKEFAEEIDSLWKSIFDTSSSDDTSAVIGLAKEKMVALVPKLEEMFKAMTEHMDGEEAELFPITRALGEKELPTFTKIYYHCRPVREKLLPFVLEFLSGPERMQYMHNIMLAVRESDPKEWALCQRILKVAFSETDWKDLVERLPQIGQEVKEEVVAVVETATTSAPAAAAAATATPAPVAVVDATPAPAEEKSEVPPISGELEFYMRFGCPFCEHVRIALTFKGLAFKMTDWTSVAEKPAWFKIASPQLTVPVLRLPDGTYMDDSEDMIGWIDKQQGQDSTASYEIDPEAREKWNTLIRSDLFPAMFKVFMAPSPAIRMEFLPKLKKTIAAITEQLESDRGGSFFIGEKYSEMDIILTPQIRRLPVITYFTGIPLSNPTIDAYVAHLESSFPYKDIVAPLDKIKESFIPKILTLPPISYIRLHHISKARHFEQAIASLKKIVVQEDASVADADSILTRLKNLCTFILEHIAFENKYTHDFMRKFEADEAALESNKEDHAYDLTEYAELKSQVEGMLADINAEADAAVVALMIKEKLEPLLSKVEFMFEKMRKHMETEEKTAASIMPKVNKEELAAVTKQYYFHSSVLREEMLPFIWETLTSVERYNYLHLVNFYMLPEEQDKEWLRLVKQVKGFVTEAEFEDLKFRIPSIVTTTNIE